MGRKHFNKKHAKGEHLRYEIDRSWSGTSAKIISCACRAKSFQKTLNVWHRRHGILYKMDTKTKAE